MRAPLAYVGTRSRRPPRSAHTERPMALPLRSQHAVSTAESASVKIPPGPELPAARLSLAAMASTWVGSSPTTRRASASTAALSAGVRAPPKKVRPTPTGPSSVPSSRVTNSRVSVGAGRPTTSGLSAGVLSTRVVTWVTFIFGSLGGTSLGAAGSEGQEIFESGEDGLGIVFVERVHGPRNLHEAAVGQLARHALGHVPIENGARFSPQHQGGQRDRAHDAPPVEIRRRAPLLHAWMPLPHEGAIGALPQTGRGNPAVVVDAVIGVAAIEMLGRLLDALPRVRLGRPRGSLGGPLADLGPDVDDDQLLHTVGPLRGEVHAVAAAHGEPDEHERRQRELIHHA